jgi:sugar transferase (PEP-CTERM/EpsH1 system associated)
MKVLWVNSNFMHPTTKGGQIRTLEMLRHLSRWHEIHYVAFEDPAHPEGPRRSVEYCFRAYPFRRRIPPRHSVAFLGQLAAGFMSSMPLSVSRFHSAEVGRFLDDLIRREHFDRAVVDHLAPTAYFPDLSRILLFQHNVETIIWRRHVEHAESAVRKFYFRLQADRMFEYERRVCRAAGHIVAVSAVDSDAMRTLFGVTRVSHIPTGVNIEYFSPPQNSPPVSDLVFIGSMDWLPNVDAMRYFVGEVLPLIRRRLPTCSLAIVGRSPSASILDLARADQLIVVTGTVPDIRPYLWGSSVSIVPLRIGGGTRLKIFESMAANVPVVSTSTGAEGLDLEAPEQIRIADTPQDFADACVALLENPAERARLAATARQLVASRFSWEQVARSFDEILAAAGPRLA